jgi:hypothetical protein
MGITIKRSNNIPKLTAALKKLGKQEIQVGVFGGESNTDHEDINMVTLARVHEFGMTITPKNGRKWLTIPLIPEAKGKRAADFPNLVFTKSPYSEIAWLSRPVTKGRGKKQTMQSVFMLVHSVKIPERSFLRAGFDENVDKITDKIVRELNKVMRFGISVDTFLDAVGTEFAGLIQKKMRNVNPPNADITKNVKRSSGTLRDTGGLIESVKHKIK